MCLRNTISIHPISSFPGSDMAPKGVLDTFNKISFLKKKLIYFLEAGPIGKRNQR